jgi:hypothetical protein
MYKYYPSVLNFLLIYKYKSCFRVPSLLFVSLLASHQIGAQHYYPGGLGNANLLIWLTAKKAVTLSGTGGVIAWGDQSGNSHNFIQGATNEAIYSATAGPNGKPALTFNASNSEFLFSQINLPNTFSLTAGISSFAMASFSAPLTGWGWQRIYDFGNGASADNFMMGRYRATANFYVEGWKAAAGDEVWTTTAPIVNGTNAVYDFVQNGGAAGTLTSVQAYVSGVAQTMSGAAGSNVTWVPAAIVRTKNYIGRSNWVADEYFGGTISEILIYNAALNTTERVIAENYLAQTWGQAISTSEYTAPAANTYTTNLVGIGYTSATDNFLADVAGSTDGLGFSSGSGATDFLNTAGYLIAAHNAQANTVIANASLPGITSAGPISEWNRSWQVQKSGGNLAGQVTFNFNFSDYNGTVPGGAQNYSLLYNATDGSFATGTNVLIPLVSTTVAGNIVAFTANISNIANGYYTVIYSSSAIILPVVVTDFQAIPGQGRSLLKWTITTASNPAGFDIERSTDAIRYASIGSVPGNADSTLPGAYSFTDDHPAAGDNYYRLKMTDRDGSVLYSNICSVNFNVGPAAGLRLYPNPATDQLTISMPGITGMVELRIVSAEGSVVRMGQFPSTGLLRVSMRGLARGVYFIEVCHGAGKYIQRFLKN